MFGLAVEEAAIADDPQETESDEVKPAEGFGEAVAEEDEYSNAEGGSEESEFSDCEVALAVQLGHGEGSFLYDGGEEMQSEYVKKGCFALER